MPRFKFVNIFRVNNYVSSLFFRTPYSLTGKWNFVIDFFQVLIYSNFSNFALRGCSGQEAQILDVF